MQIKIVKVEPKKSKDGQKDYFILHTDKDAQISTFETGIKDGDVLDGEIELSGKYINLVKGFKIISSAPSGSAPAQVPQVERVFKADPERQWSIERQSI